MKKLILLLVSLIPAFSQAQSYSISWYKVAGGGGTSAGTNGSAVYSLSGTIGQQDASTAMSGNGYSLTGGYWSLIALVQTAGTPNLSITHSGTSVIIQWPNTGSYTLQQNNNLAQSAGWTASGYAVTTNSPAGTNSVTINPATGTWFFRLANP
ncbi:MAG: hypothetical protein ABSA83_00105 [Verrucomicrobiota bacterium]|jgi:hypothetical protein